MRPEQAAPVANQDDDNDVRPPWCLAAYPAIEIDDDARSGEEDVIEIDEQGRGRIVQRGHRPVALLEQIAHELDQSDLAVTVLLNLQQPGPTPLPGYASDADAVDCASQDVSQPGLDTRSPCQLGPTRQLPQEPGDDRLRQVATAKDAIHLREQRCLHRRVELADPALDMGSVGRRYLIASIVRDCARDRFEELRSIHG